MNRFQMGKILTSKGGRDLLLSRMRKKGLFLRQLGATRGLCELNNGTFRFHGFTDETSSRLDFKSRRLVYRTENDAGPVLLYHYSSKERYQFVAIGVVHGSTKTGRWIIAILKNRLRKQEFEDFGWRTIERICDAKNAKRAEIVDYHDGSQVLHSKTLYPALRMHLHEMRCRHSLQLLELQKEFNFLFF